MNEEFYEDDRYFEIMKIVDNTIILLEEGEASLEEVISLLNTAQDV